MGGLDKHLFEAGGFDVVEFFELGRMSGNEFVEVVEVCADLRLFVVARSKDFDLVDGDFREARNPS